MNSMTLTPLLDLIVVRPDEADDVTAGGIVLPDTAKKSQTATVVAVGPGRIRDNGVRVPLEVKVGDTVIFTDDPRGKIEIHHGGEELFVLAPSNVLAVVAK